MNLALPHLFRIKKNHKIRRMKRITALIKVFSAVTILGVLGHIAFYLLNLHLISGEGDASFFPMLWNALRLDVAVAGYASFLPALIFLVSVWWKGIALVYLLRCYFGIIAIAMTLANMANIVLYGYWGFPLDATPLFYLISSPSDAMASIGTGELIVSLIIVLFIAVMIYLAFDAWVHPRRTIQGRYRRHERHHRHASLKARLLLTVYLVLLTALLIIPVRGGFSVATNNVGSVFFSSNYRLNHCAVNPVFSFIYSLLHDEDFSSKYRFMDDKEATSIFKSMIYTSLRTDTPADSAKQTVSLSPHFTSCLEAGMAGEEKGVNVVMVILEGFSKYIMSETGHVAGVTANLDALASQGVYFTNFYANSFRTDRALVSILSGYPAQPTTSLMKFPQKTNSLQGIARSMNSIGFATKYFYGGDADFTNMRAYLRATGFEDIVSEENFPSDIPRTKWGIDDNYVFDRAVKDLAKGNMRSNRFFVVQTSSSHEPYEVPVKRLEDKALNAFFFADQCLGDFIAQLKKKKIWDNTLLVIVPDHLGCYPNNPDNFQLYRYQIPLILSGGAITTPQRIPTIGAQQDIPATLLALLGQTHDDYRFSKDLLDDKAPHFAFFTVPDAVGMVTDDNQLIYDNAQQMTVLDAGKAKGKNLRKAQAYLQKLYDDIDMLGK